MLDLPFVPAAPIMWDFRLLLPRRRQPAPPARRRAAQVVAPESFVLAALCLLDLSSTIWWVSYREATEGNPIMAYYLLHGGTLAFALVKLVLLIMPLIIVEWARQTRPRFVHSALRVGIAGYIGLYALGVAHINHAEADGGGEPTEYAAPIAARSVHANPALRSVRNPSACGQPAYPARLMQDEE